jgi:hypothetical protein
VSESNAFKAYPNIDRLHQFIGGTRGMMQQFCEDANLNVPLLDDSLATIDATAKGSLSGLAKDLFSNDLGKVHAAICEFLGFAWLKQKSLLTEADIGYPRDWPGDDPPFEGVLVLGGAEVAFDVKDGSGSGQTLLKSLLEKALAQEAQRAAIEPPPLHLALNSPSGQKWVHDNFRLLVTPFTNELRTSGFSERTLKYEAGSGYIRVGIGRRVGGSIAGISEKASFVASQIATHASHKHKSLNKTNASRFMLIYVRRAGVGLADFNEHTVRQAFNFLASRSDVPATLVGVCFLDFDRSSGSSAPLAILWDRAGTLAQHFGSTGCELYSAIPTETPEQRQQSARGLVAASIEPPSAVVMGSCELRGSKCLASGSAGSVFVFFHQDQQYLACIECQCEFAWPAPTGGAHRT